MQLHKDSHLDHSLTAEQVAFLLKVFADRTAFFIETIELPEHLGTVPCGLYGPVMGDPPIEDCWVEHRRRPPREYTSRMLVRHEYPGGFPGPQAGKRRVRTVTVIAGPHEEACKHCAGTGDLLHDSLAPTIAARHPCAHCKNGKVSYGCILYTAYGGPCVPQEPGDPSCRDRAASEAFWAQHALVRAD